MVIDKGTFYFPKMLNDLADELAYTRSKISANIYHKNSMTYRGNKEHEISKKGILGELIARDFLNERNIPHKTTPIIDLKPIVEPDIYIDKKGLDVKTVTKGSQILSVNFESHNNISKRPNFYWFVQLEDQNIASHFFVKSHHVDSWQIKKLRYTKAYITINNHQLKEIK